MTSQAFETFAARRRAIFEDADGVMRPVVEAALKMYGSPDAWDAVIDQASNLWLSILTDEAPDAFPDRIIEDFRQDLRDSLAKTAQPSDPPTDTEINRVTEWIGTFTVNSATWYAGRAEGDRTKTWLTMHDGTVRPMHHAVDGQVRPIGGSFDVGGHKLRFPGEPVGPPEVWINCRCIMVPGGARGMTAAAGTSEIDEELELTYVDEDPNIEDADDLEEVDIEGEDLVDDGVDEIPVHGIAAPMGIPTGDGRMFAEGALTWRELPLPIRYEFVSTHGGDTSHVSTVGRIDEMWVDDDNNVRYRGVIVVSKQYADDVIEGIVDGTVRGVSIEVDDTTMDVTEDRERLRALLEAGAADPGSADSVAKSDLDIEAMLDDMVGDGTRPVSIFKAARICGFTVVPIPAYQEAYIALGEAFEDELSKEDLAALEACGCLASDGDEDEEFREVKSSERKKLADEGKAMPDGSYPIATEEDLRNAIQAIGRAKDPEAVKRHIKRRAKALGKEDLVPEDWSGEIESFAPGTKDGPGWITHPRATARIRRYWVSGKGAGKIRWGAPGDFNRCRRQLAKYVQNPNWLAGLCANMHKEALGIWPGEHHSTSTLVASGHDEGSWTFTITAGGERVFDHSLFEKPDLEAPVGIKVEGNHIYGYVATWGVCHISYSDQCVQAPHSATDYAYFATGSVDTDEGPVSVGSITMGTGHAAMNLRARPAASHYDNTGSVVADVAIGEDEFGIWFSGVLRDDVTDEQLHALKASGRLSGDWRQVGTFGKELVAALAVNVPGFPIPAVSLAASAGEEIALVAAGIVEPEEAAISAGGALLDADSVAAISRAAVGEYISEQDRRARLAATKERRAQFKAARVAKLRARVTKES